MSTSPKRTHESDKSYRVSERILTITGIGLILLGSILLLPSVLVMIRQEVSYATMPETKKLRVPEASGEAVLKPVDPFFSIVIPKIDANARIISNVDPFTESEYQLQLTTGIAHARGTVYPGDPGNMFLFAHSAGTAREASQYNAVFYLIGKLEENDPIYVFYQGRRYTYRVTGSQLVDEDQVEYLDAAVTSDGTDGTGKTLTLMTCWPAGTTFRRLLVTAELN